LIYQENFSSKKNLPKKIFEIGKNDKNKETKASQSVFKISGIVGYPFKKMQIFPSESRHNLF